MLTNWERLDHVLRGGVPDRLPLLHVWGDHDRYVQQTIAARGYPGDGDERYLSYRHDEGFATGRSVGWFSPLPRGGADVDGVHRYVQGGLTSGAPLDPFEHLGDLDALAAQCRGVVSANRRFGLGTIGYITNCIHAVATAMGWEAFALAVYDEPDWLDAALEQAERHNRRGLEVMFDAGVELICFDGDCAYRSGLMLSPQAMRRLWFERTRRTLAWCQRADRHALFHSDGKADDLLPMLIELGFAAFHGCEKQANDLGELKRRFGDRITLVGNADHVELTHGTPQQIAADTARMLAAAAPGGRYVPDVNTLVPDCPIENYAAFHETILRLGTYPREG